MTTLNAENFTLAAAARLTKALIARNPSMTSIEAVDSVLSLYSQLVSITTRTLPQNVEDLEVAIGNVEVAPLVPAVPIEDSVHDDYPITAPGYSAQKAAEAHAVGLGHHANKRGAARQTEHNEQVQAAA